MGIVFSSSTIRKALYRYLRLFARRDTGNLGFAVVAYKLGNFTVICLLLVFAELNYLLMKICEFFLTNQFSIYYIMNI